MIGLGLSITQLAVRQLVGQFNPMKLFALGEQGAWYDPSDLSTLYQDAAGTTPVTAVEQPVGLMLDKSKGLVLGPELRGSASVALVGSATPATYDEATGTGTVYRDADVNNQGYVALTGLTLGRAYLVTLTITSGQMYVRVGPHNGAVPAGLSPTRQIAFVTASEQISITTGPTNFTSASFSDLSVRELPGAHAFQTTATSRPVLSARVNAYVVTENYSDAYWTKSRVTLESGIVGPHGRFSTKLVEDATSGYHDVFRISPHTIGVPLIFVALMKAGERNQGHIRNTDLTSGGYDAIFDLTGTGTATLITSPTGSWTGGLAAITPIEDGWYICTLRATPGASVSSAWGAGPSASSLANYEGVSGNGIFVAGLDIRPANQADLPYQRVNTATDYDAGPAFPRYLRCDGIDDGMVTGTITPGTDKAQVFAGVRKLSDAASGILMELSFEAAANPGSFGMVAPSASGANSYRFQSRGALWGGLGAGSGVFAAAPDTSVLSGIGSISEDVSTLRRNGVLVETYLADQGTGNYLAYPLYLFRRGGTTLPFNGHFYGAVIRFGDNLPIETIQQTEAYMAAKTGVTL